MSATTGQPLNWPVTAEQLRRLSPAQLSDAGAQLGLRPPEDEDAEEQVRRILIRQKFLQGIDRSVLVELAEWTGRRVPDGATRPQLAQLIHRSRKMSFGSLTHKSLLALARLREADVTDDDDAHAITQALKRQESLLGKFGRKRRRLIGKLVAKLVGEQPRQPDREADNSPQPSLKERIEEHGLVGGLAEKLRGAADDYVAVKLDEIEQRIDRKLEDIDRRLAEWRDREIENRLRIIKITLVASIIVALISVFYAWMKVKLGS